MEDNNSFLIKTIAGALILILALNVYRTESTKKQMDRLAATVDSLSIRVGALEYPDFSDIGSGAVRNMDNKAVAEIAKGLTGKGGQHLFQSLFRIQWDFRTGRIRQGCLRSREVRL